mmetsp:Transcript_11051/g.34121  ORF Transcript_11051/g.34121 Transcript_11051/m.34121 type:complete len:226 (+) Transcript_11051:1174-1851(+)
MMGRGCCPWRIRAQTPMAPNSSSRSNQLRTSMASILSLVASLAGSMRFPRLSGCLQIRTIDRWSPWPSRALWCSSTPSTMSKRRCKRRTSARQTRRQQPQLTRQSWRRKTRRPGTTGPLTGQRHCARAWANISRPNIYGTPLHPPRRWRSRLGQRKHALHNQVTKCPTSLDGESRVMRLPCIATMGCNVAALRGARWRSINSGPNTYNGHGTISKKNLEDAYYCY